MYISLAEVTDDYMRHVSAMQELSLPNTSQFVALAATLLLVKSKSLLPILDLTEEEEATIEDLEERLRKYQVVKEASLKLQAMFGKSTLYAPQFTPPTAPIFVPDQFCSLDSLTQAIKEVLTNLPKTEIIAKAQVKTTISLEQMIDRLQQRIARDLQVRFSDLYAGETERKVVIVGFLAILELFKQGNLLIEQGERFAEIHIELDQSQTPRYL